MTISFRENRPREKWITISPNNLGSSVRSLGDVQSTASPRMQSTLHHLLRLAILCIAPHRPVLDEPVPDQLVPDQPVAPKSRVVSEIIRGCAVNGINPRAGSTLHHLLRLAILCIAPHPPVGDEPVPEQLVPDQPVDQKSRVVSEVIRGCAVNTIAPRAEYPAPASDSLTH